MSLNNTPSSDRVHIGIFGSRNAGKSSLINALTGQNLSIVSEILGTTTDPVLKTMELLPLGPVVMIDTPGLDDIGELGKMRVKKSYQILNKTDIALVVVDSTKEITQSDTVIIDLIKKKGIPYLVVYNKTDLSNININTLDSISVSSLTMHNIKKLKEKIASIIPEKKNEYPIISDKVNQGDAVVLVIPIDSSAPKGRLILPQQQTIRELLESKCTVVSCLDSELENTLSILSKKPRLVITDSQVFGKVSKIVPEDTCLTSFSILFARHKGRLEKLVAGSVILDKLNNGDKILISEGCTHHRQCGDIGTVKLPHWIQEYCNKNIVFDFTSGTEFPDDLSEYRLIIHCGGCMLNEREMKYRTQCADDANIPITNYGMAIAHMNGILKRSLSIFPEIAENII